MDYLKLLEHSYAMAVALDECPPDSRLEYLGEQVFGFTTYDGEMSALFAGKAIEVCGAINNGATFDYIKDPENYRWFLLMCNMPFFADRLEWGTSIRGAWWDCDRLESCGLYEGDEQVLSLNFTRDEWDEFAKALVVFALLTTENVMSTDTAILDWLENQYGLHREVEITYVVDGYEVEFTYDGNPTDGKQYRGETLRDALRKAMNAVPN